MQNIKTKLFAGFCAIISFFGCRPHASNGRTKNVDALNQGTSSVQRNQTCESRNQLNRDDVWGTQIIGLNKVDLASVNQTILTVLGAAPKVISEAFLARGGTSNRATGFIAIHGSYSPSLCKSRNVNDSTTVASGNGNPSACWGLDQGRHVVRIFANPNASTVDVNKLIHNYLLVEVAFLYDDYMNFLAEQDLDKLLPTSGASNQVNIVSIKKTLGQYMSARDSFAQILGARKNLRKDEVSVQKIQALYMAEAVDAFYCSVATKHEFETAIPEAFEHFSRKVGPVLGQ